MRIPSFTHPPVRSCTALAAVTLAVMSLVGCQRGEVAGVTGISDVSATLHGTVHSDDPTPTYWFEYDPSPEVVDGTLRFESSSPRNRWGCCGPMLTASTNVTGLEPETTYWYRLCIENGDGLGMCGAAGSFTTREPGDSVEGEIGIPVIPELGYGFGVTVSARSAADGSDPTGQVSRTPGSYYFRWPDNGTVTCMRVVGNRASIGFVATDYIGHGEPDVAQVVFVEDNGPSGDRFGHQIVDEAPLECPDPTTFEDLSTATVGDLTVVDREP